MYVECDKGRYLISTSNLYTHVCEQWNYFRLREVEGIGELKKKKQPNDSTIWDYLGDGGEEQEEGGKRGR